MKNIQIASFHYRHEGEQARGYLADAGIGSLLHGDAGSAASGASVPAARVRVFVREDDADRARALLDDADDLVFG